MSFIQAKTTVSKVGKLEDYSHLPIIKDGKPIGVINNATETSQGYELSMIFFKNDFNIDLLNNEPISMTFN